MLIPVLNNDENQIYISDQTVDCLVQVPKKRGRLHDLYIAGEIYGAHEALISNFLNPILQSVTAAPGTYLHSQIVDSETGAASCEKQPIIAWNLRFTGPPEPVVSDCSTLEGEELFAVQYPDGRVEEPYLATYDSAEAWLAYRNTGRKEFIRHVRVYERTEKPG